MEEGTDRTGGLFWLAAMLPVGRWLCCRWRRGCAAGGDAAVLPVGGGLWSDTMGRICCRWGGGYAAGGDAAMLPVGGGKWVCIDDNV